MTKELIALVILTAITTACWVGFKVMPPPRQTQDTFVGKTVEPVIPVLQTEVLEELKN